MIAGVREEQAKRIPTKDLQGHPNGYVLELLKDGSMTKGYLTAIAPNGFKGYHYHKERSATYIVLKGAVKVILYKKGQREEHIVQGDTRLQIPKQIATGILNLTDDEAWLINFPNPPYDPAVKGEQIDYTEEELKKGLI
jgi:dTDP-4-dehydrorhamnose 3,5-epimerase-like enzyme